MQTAGRAGGSLSCRSRSCNRCTLCPPPPRPCPQSPGTCTCVVAWLYGCAHNDHPMRATAGVQAPAEQLLAPAEQQLAAHACTRIAYQAPTHPPDALLADTGGGLQQPGVQLHACRLLRTAECHVPMLEWAQQRRGEHTAQPAGSTSRTPHHHRTGRRLLALARRPKAPPTHFGLEPIIQLARGHMHVYVPPASHFSRSFAAGRPAAAAPMSPDRASEAAEVTATAAKHEGRPGAKSCAGYRESWRLVAGETKRTSGWVGCAGVGAPVCAACAFACKRGVPASSLIACGNGEVRQVSTALSALAFTARPARAAWTLLAPKVHTRRGQKSGTTFRSSVS